MEIEMFFAKYDEDGDGMFSMKEESLVMKDLDKDIVDSQVTNGRGWTLLDEGGVARHVDLSLFVLLVNANF